MVTRYSVAQAKTLLSKRFKVAFSNPFKPIFNAAQSQQLPIITNIANDRVTYSQWGIIPYDAQDKEIGDKLINARMRTILAKQPFCDLLSEKRCIIIADGFYIWKEVNNVKTPFRVTKKDGQPFAIAGIWDEWEMEDQEAEQKLFHSFSMITTTATPELEDINDRMPLILPQEAESEWLKNGQDNNYYNEILKLEDKEDLIFYRVPNLVNKESNNTKKVIQKVDAPSAGMTMSLFD